MLERYQRRRSSDSWDSVPLNGSARPSGPTAKSDTVKNDVCPCWMQDGGLPVNERRIVSLLKERNVPPASHELRPGLATDKQQQLFSGYPLFFRSVRFPEAYPSNLAFFGILCGFAWYELIEAVAQDIEAELRSMWCEQAHSIENMATMDRRLLKDHSGVCRTAQPAAVPATRAGDVWAGYSTTHGITDACAVHLE